MGGLICWSGLCLFCGVLFSQLDAIEELLLEDEWDGEIDLDVVKDVIDGISVGLGIGLGICAISIISNILLIIGANKHRPVLLLPCIITLALFLAYIGAEIYAVTAVIGGVFIVAPIVFQIGGFVFICYMFICVWSFRKQLLKAGSGPNSVTDM